MKLFQCRCGQTIYFESHSCINCGALLRFDPAELRMRSLDISASGALVDASGESFVGCENGRLYGNCNWLRPAADENPLCFGCQFNRTIPALTSPESVRRWSRLETSKKRLFYTLLSLRLPLVSGHKDPDNGLLLDFVEDSRTDPYRYPEAFLHTGFLGGVVTINVLEADDVAREAVKAEMNESYRTVLGHLRHESGHYYWSLFAPDDDDVRRFEELFGYIGEDYGASLERYYTNGPAPDWPTRCISAYASAHPVEDWAESWGHYLHIFDVLETAAAHGVTDTPPFDGDIRSRIATWRSLSITLNELNRSIGLGDAYPFVVNGLVEEKLVYVDSVIARLRLAADK